MRCIGVLAGRWVIAAASRRRPLSDGPRPVRSRAPCGGVRSRGRATPPSSGRPATRSRSADSGYVRGPGGHAAGQPRCRVHRRALTLRWPRQNEQGDVNGARWHGTATICKCEKPPPNFTRWPHLQTGNADARPPSNLRDTTTRSPLARCSRSSPTRRIPRPSKRGRARRSGARGRRGAPLSSVWSRAAPERCGAFASSLLRVSVDRRTLSRAQDRPSLQAKGGCSSTGTHLQVDHVDRREARVASPASSSMTRSS